MNRWLNFRQIKEAVPIGAVLEHYGWQCLRRRGDRVEGRCPIHRGQGDDAFHADRRNNGFHCFSCGAHGSVLDLVAAMELCSLRRVALLLEDWFGVERSALSSGSGLGGEQQRELIREKERVDPPPLWFSLQPVDSGHTYLKQRAIHADTAAHFGVGYYAGPGLLHGRMVLPIHNERGQLLAYAGRSIDEARPKYKFPAGFGKSDVLFNLHRARARSKDTVIVVEGFFDCLKVHQAGQPGVVALMGCCLSAQQETLLLERFGTIVLMLDADLAGQQATRRIARRLMNRSRIDVVNLTAGRQPDQMSSEDIRRVLSAALRPVQTAI
jgi:DNA primase